MAGRKLSEPVDLIAFFSILKNVADRARSLGWDVQITINTGEVEAISMSATRSLPSP